MTRPENKEELIFKEIRQLIAELHPNLRPQPTVTLEKIVEDNSE